MCASRGVRRAHNLRARPRSVSLHLWPCKHPAHRVHHMLLHGAFALVVVSVVFVACVVRERVALEGACTCTTFVRMVECC